MQGSGCEHHGHPHQPGLCAGRHLGADDGGHVGPAGGGGEARPLPGPGHQQEGARGQLSTHLRRRPGAHPGIILYCLTNTVSISVLQF